MELLVLLVAGFVLTQGAGYAVHAFLHWPRSGPFHRGHIAHHQLYPPDRFLSRSYRNPRGWQRNVLLFLPFLLLLAGLLFVLAPLDAAALLVCELVVLSWLNSAVHDALHRRGVWLERYRFFRRLRALHRTHHHDMHTNLGIFSWAWDRWLGTFRNRGSEEGRR